MQNIFAKNIYKKACIISFSVLVLIHNNSNTMTTEQKAIELLKTRIDTMDVQINDGLVDYSYEDLIDFIECTEFLSVVMGVTYDTRKAIEQLENVSQGN